MEREYLLQCFDWLKELHGSTSDCNFILDSKSPRPVPPVLRGAATGKCVSSVSHQPALFPPAACWAGELGGGQRSALCDIHRCPGLFSGIQRTVTPVSLASFLTVLIKFLTQKKGKEDLFWFPV